MCIIILYYYKIELKNIFSFKKISNLKIKLIATAAFIAFLIFAYIIKLPCIFVSFFNIPCPGCGMTRAWISALHLDFSRAFAFHPMFWSMPVCYLFVLYDGKPFKNRFINIILLILIALGFIITYILKLSNPDLFLY